MNPRCLIFFRILSYIEFSRKPWTFRKNPENSRDLLSILEKSTRVQLSHLWKYLIILYRIIVYKVWQVNKQITCLRDIKIFRHTVSKAFQWDLDKVKLFSSSISTRMNDKQHCKMGSINRINVSVKVHKFNLHKKRMKSMRL